MEFLSKLISRVLDPILLVPVMLSLAVWEAYMVGQGFEFLFFLLLVDGLLPGFVLYFFIQRDVIHSGWDIRDRKERIPLFLFVVLAHAVGVMAAWMFGAQPLALYLTSFWVLTLLYAATTIFWKISIHVGVMSAFATFAVLVEGPEYLWLYTLVLLLIWARVYGRYHKPSQAIAGALLPPLILPLCFKLLELV